MARVDAKQTVCPECGEPATEAMIETIEWWAFAKGEAFPGDVPDDGAVPEAARDEDRFILRCDELHEWRSE